MNRKLKPIMTYFKPYDYLLILVAIVISFIPLVVTSYYQSAATSSEALVAVVKINGKVADEFPLKKGGEHQEKTYYPQKGHYNIIEIDGEQIRVKEDNSPDQIAVRTGWISQPGQVSVCLPHQLIIEIQGSSSHSYQDNEDELILPL
ncbi:NusG domain II-containing protein [Streptococcus canis]|nr:NusG domain II-containing protein [Streptococcus canis]